MWNKPVVVSASLLIFLSMLTSCYVTTVKPESGGITTQGQDPTIDVSPAVRVTNTGNPSGDGYYERDPQLLIASNGSWFIAYSKSSTIFTHGGNPDDLRYDIYVRKSSDAGTNWSLETKVLDAASIGVSSSFRSSTICEADGKIWVIAADIKNLEGDIYANTYSGGAWSGQVMIFDGTYSTGAFHLDSIVEGNDIRLFYGIQQESQGVGFIKYHSSTHTWDDKVTKVGLSAGYQVPRVVKAGSTFYMVSTDWSHILFTKTTTPDAVPWPSATYVSDAPPGGAACDPTILKYGESNGTDDLIVFSSPSYSDNSQPIVYTYSTDAGATWTSPIAFTDAIHGAQVSWDMMSRAYLKDASTILLFYSMEQRGVDRGQGDIVACNWNITSTIGHKHYTTIQDGIDSANSGDKIAVSAGTYMEKIDIYKPLAVIGDSADTSIIDGTGVTSTSGGLVSITANSGNVIFDGFTVKQNPSLGDTEVGIGILARSSLAGPTYTITNNKIYGTNNPNCEQDYGFYASYGKENMVFKQNLITQTGSNNIVVEQHEGAIEISHNTLDTGCWGIDPIFVMAYDGLAVPTLQNISYNMFDMGTGTQFDYGATGISICTPGADPDWGIGDATFNNVLISGNVFNNLKDHRRGIGTWNANNTSHNLLDLQIIGNTINGVPGSAASFGIDFYGLTDNANVIGNTIQGTDTAIYLRNGDAPGTQISHNNIAENTVGLNWTNGSTVNASSNWWGDPTGPYDPTSNPSGKGEIVIGLKQADFEPWLIKPYPPATAVQTLLYVNPPNVGCSTPSFGQNFTVQINVQDAENLFGYEFKLFWNTTLLDLIKVQITPPWPSFIGKNETNEALGRYWLGIASIGSAFNGSATLTKLTFKVTYDPIYPANMNCKLALADSILTAPGGKLIYHMTHDGSYSISSVEPRITISTTPSEVTALGGTVKVDIYAHNIVNLYEFSFKLGYNATLLEVTSVEVDFLSTPFLYYPTMGTGYVMIWAWSVSPAPCTNGTGLLASITLKAKKASIWPDPALNCSLHLYDVSLKTKEGHLLLCTTQDGRYIYQPKPGDLNADGKVDLIDLRFVAYYYDPAYNRTADLNRDGKVNVIDLSIVSTNYGS